MVLCLGRMGVRVVFGVSEMFELRDMNGCGLENSHPYHRGQT